MSEENKKKDPPSDDESSLDSEKKAEEWRVAALTEMEEGLPKPIIGQLCISFLITAFVSLLLFFLFFFVLKWQKENTEGCGIDVYTWLQVFLSLVTLGACILLPILCCLMTMHPLNALSCALLGICLLTVAIATWIVYGYYIYFSDDNDCQEKYDTAVALVFMCIFLIFGLCTICAAVTLFFAVPIVYFASVRPIMADPEAKKENNFSNEMLIKGWKHGVQRGMPQWTKDKKNREAKAKKDEENEGGQSDEENALIQKNKGTYKRSNNRE